MKSKIAVVTHGRFHSFDLAEQLQNARRLVAVYTGYPRFKLRNTHVEQHFIRSFPWFHVPEIALLRYPYLPTRVRMELAWAAGRSLDLYAKQTLPECDVVTALSGSGLRTGAEVQKRGGVYVCDRGSAHIRWQQHILDEEYGKLGWFWSGIDARIIAREEEEYALADAVTVPSGFALRSFIEMGVPAEKLRLIPYGVNLSRFRRCAERAPKFRVLFVGGLSPQKGVHYLLEAFHRAALPGSELVLVGSAMTDTKRLLALRPVDNVTMTGPVSREKVALHMSRASVLVLPSVQDGFGMVMAQAMGCGCPVIATTHTGAEDLFEDGREGFVIQPRDVEALAERLTRLYRDKDLHAAMSDAAEARVKHLGGWDTYGRNSMRVFDELLAAKRSPVAPQAEAR